MTFYVFLVASHVFSNTDFHKVAVYMYIGTPCTCVHDSFFNNKINRNIFSFVFNSSPMLYCELTCTCAYGIQMKSNNDVHFSSNPEIDSIVSI